MAGDRLLGDEIRVVCRGRIPGPVTGFSDRSDDPAVFEFEDGQVWQQAVPHYFNMAS